jgi:hypothetical protein
MFCYQNKLRHIKNGNEWSSFIMNIIANALDRITSLSHLINVITHLAYFTAPEHNVTTYITYFTEPERNVSTHIYNIVYRAGGMINGLYYFLFLEPLIASHDGCVKYLKMQQRCESLHKCLLLIFSFIYFLSNPFCLNASTGHVCESGVFLELRLVIVSN